MKKKGLKVLLGIFLVLLALMLVLVVGVSPFLKNYIEKNSQELVGRKMRMNDLRLNLFTGTLYLDAVRMYEKDDTTLFASIDSFYVDLELLKLLERRVEVAQLRIVRPYAAIIQEGEHFNFDDLMPTDEDSTAVETETSSFPKSVLIKDIYIGGGLLTYTDLLLDNTIRMNDLGVAIPELAFERGNTNAGIHLKVGESATLDSQLTMNMQTNEYVLSLQLLGLPVEMIKPYVAEYLHIDQLKGAVSTDVQIKGNTDHLMDFSISGTAKATDFVLTNALKEPVVEVAEASVKMERVHLPSSTFLLDSVGVRGGKLDFLLHRETDNFTALFKPEADTAAVDTTAAEPMTLIIGSLHVAESNLVYVVDTLKSGTFTLPLSNVDFVSRDFDLNGTNTYEVKASGPNGGKIDFSWKANMDNLANQEIRGNFRNIDLRLFTPFCLDYTAYDITKGIMNFTTNNRIKDNFIQSMNKIDIYNMRVGKKNPDIQPEYNLPLKMALYVLRDKDEKIEFDIPVKGNINDPEFSYKQIVFKTIVNLLVKVSVSPVRFLANSLGLNPDEMASMGISALQLEINAQQYSQLNELAGIYLKKPEMLLQFTQFVDLNKALNDYAMYQAKGAFLLSRVPETDSIRTRPLPPYEDLEKMIPDDDAQFRSFVDGRILEKGLAVKKNQAFSDKLFAIYSKDSIQGSLFDQLEKRNQDIRNYLTTTGGIPSTNLQIKTASLDSLTLYGGKDQYTIDLNLAEE